MPVVVTLKGGELCKSSGLSGAIWLLPPIELSASLAHTFFHSCANRCDEGGTHGYE